MGQDKKMNTGGDAQPLTTKLSSPLMKTPKTAKTVSPMPRGQDIALALPRTTKPAAPIKQIIFSRYTAYYYRKIFLHKKTPARKREF